MKYIRFAEGTKYPDSEKVIADTADNFEDAGFVLEEHMVVIDIDVLEQEQLEALYKLLQPKSQYVFTDRGVHFYYKVNRGEKYPGKYNCFLGFPVELKTKYITIKRNGVHREMMNEDKFEELPWFFKPCKEQSALGLVDGDMRHNVLFKYKLQCHKHSMCNDILNYINDHIFAESKDDGHMSSLMKQTIKFDPDDAADRVTWVITECEPVFWNSTVFYKIDGDYTCDTLQIKRKIDSLMPDLRTAEWEELIKKIHVRAKVIDDNVVLPIVLANGYLHRGRFVPGEYRGFSPYIIDREYKTNAKRPACQDGYVSVALSGDNQLEKYIFQIFAASFIVDPKKRAESPRIHFITGDGGNAKGTTTKKGGGLFGARNKGTSKPHDFEDEQKIIAIKNKLICIGEDVKDKAINADIMERLKNISSADEMTLRALYSGAEDGITVCTNLVFTSNHILSSFEKGESWRRRAYWIKFDKVFKQPDSWWKEWHSEETDDYWFKRMVEEYFELYQSGFCKCDAVDSFSQEYHDENDTVLMFLTLEDGSKREAEDFLGKTPAALYSEFSEFCINVLGYDKPTTSPKPFSARMMSEYNMKSSPRKVNGKSTRIYISN